MEKPKLEPRKIADAKDGNAAKDKLTGLKALFASHKANQDYSKVTKHLLAKLGDGEKAEKKNDLRHKVLRYLECTKFELLISLFILLELICVIVEVSITYTVNCSPESETRRIRMLSSGGDPVCDPKTTSRSCEAAEVLRYISISFLVFFAVELTLKFVLAPKCFVSHFGHVLDIVVVAVSLIFEFTLHNAQGAIELLVIFRSWHIIRIVHGFYEQYHKLLAQEHILHESEDALCVTLRYIDDKGLHDDFSAFCLAKGDLDELVVPPRKGEEISSL